MLLLLKRMETTGKSLHIIPTKLTEQGLFVKSAELLFLSLAT